MLAAAFGDLPPVQGALLQQAIGIAVIPDALQALAWTSGRRRVRGAG